MPQSAFIRKQQKPPVANSCLGERNRIRAQDIPLDWVRGVERLHRLPAHAGVPRFLLSVRHSHGAFGRACPIRYPSGRPENQRQSFPSLTEPSPAGFLLARVEIG
jgi:hypothetical protein